MLSEELSLHLEDGEVHPTLMVLSLKCPACTGADACLMNAMDSV